MKGIIIYIVAGLLIAGSIYGVFVYSQPLEEELVASLTTEECPACPECPTCPESESCPEPEPCAEIKPSECEPEIITKEVIKEVIKEVPVEKIVEKVVIKEVPVEKIVYQDRIVYQEIPQQCLKCPTCEEILSQSSIETNIILSLLNHPPPYPQSEGIYEFKTIGEDFIFQEMVYIRKKDFPGFSYMVNQGKDQSVCNSHGYNCGWAVTEYSENYPNYPPAECYSHSEYSFIKSTGFWGQHSSCQMIFPQDSTIHFLTKDEFEIIAIRFIGATTDKTISLSSLDL